MTRRLAVLLAACLAGGCILPSFTARTREDGVGAPPDATASFRPGVTERRDVLHALGPPTGAGAMGERDILYYVNQAQRVTKFALLYYGFQTAEIVSSTRERTGADMYLFEFDQAGVLLDWRIVRDAAALNFPLPID